MIDLMRFNKLWMALLAPALAVLQRKTGIDLFGVQQEIIDLGLMVVAAILVYMVPNKGVSS